MCLVVKGRRGSEKARRRLGQGRSGSEWSRWSTEVKLFSPVVLYGPSDIIIRHETMLNVDF